MDNLQLSEFAKRAKDGDKSAFEKIYIELSPEIYAIICEITQNKEESYDLVQDCFVAAMENISTLKEPDKIKNWLIRIAANKSRDYLKKKKPSVLTEDQYSLFENLEEENSANLPEPSLETDERIEDMREILDNLTEDKRLCILLRYRYDMSYADIAQELGITENAVKSRIFRAKEDIEKEAEKRRKKGLPLFGVAPFGLAVFALKKSADITAASFAGSAAQTAALAGATAASQAGIAAASTASTASTAATGIGAKVAAMSVAQKVVAGVAAASVVTGSATVTTVVVKNRIESETTTVYTEEVTTAPDYGFEDEIIFAPAVSESETSATELSTSAEKRTSAATYAETSVTKTATAAETASTTVKKTTTTKRTTTTTTEKVTTTRKPTTTTKPTTTGKETTSRATTTTTTEKTETTTTTKPKAKATVTVTLYTSGSDETQTKTLTFDDGETISDSVVEQRLMSDYGIDAVSDSISETAQSGASYSVDAYIIS